MTRETPSGISTYDIMDYEHGGGSFGPKEKGKMRRWQSHKIVEAERILYFANTITVKTVTIGGVAGLDSETIDVPENFFARGAPDAGDYLVRYDNSYLSWSPKKAFEDGYTLFNEDDISLIPPAKWEPVEPTNPLASDDAFALMCMAAHRLGTLIDVQWAFQKELIDPRLVPLFLEFEQKAAIVKKALTEWGYIK